MTVSPGFTADEIRGFVEEYACLEHGSKGAWLTAHSISRWRMSRWVRAYHYGDLDSGLIPRKGARITMRSTKLQAERALEAANARIASLEAKVHELEQVNDVLGKAIGLLHDLNAQEPNAIQSNELSS